MARSLYKAPYCHPSVFKKVMAASKSGKMNVGIKVRSRSTAVFPQFVGFVFLVYNGKDYIPVKVNENMVGFKLGDFAPTRKFVGHAGDKKASRR